MFIFDYTEKTEAVKRKITAVTVLSSQPAAPFSLRAGRTAGRFQKQKIQNLLYSTR